MEANIKAEKKTASSHNQKNTQKAQHFLQDAVLYERIRPKVACFFCDYKGKHKDIDTCINPEFCWRARASVNRKKHCCDNSAAYTSSSIKRYDRRFRHSCFVKVHDHAVP